MRKKGNKEGVGKLQKKVLTKELEKANIAKKRFIKKLLIIIGLVIVLMLLAWGLLVVIEKIGKELGEEDDSGLEGGLASGPMSSMGSGDYIDCRADEDCGEGYNWYFCRDDDVYVRIATRTCENPGSISSSCVIGYIDKVVKDCGEEGCKQGKCLTNPNLPPLFLSAVCGAMTLIKNTAYTLDMNICFEDPEGDTLTFRFDDTATDEIGIIQSGSELIFTPATDFLGTGTFVMYADDGRDPEISSGDIPIEVKEEGPDPPGPTPPGPTPPGPDPPTPGVTIPIILGFLPIGELIEFNYSEGDITFSINATNYTDIEWYLDNVLVVGATGTSYTPRNLSVGNHTILVRIINAEEFVLNTWKVYVPLFPVDGDDGDEEGERSTLIYLIVIFTILGILILLVILLVIKTILDRDDEEQNLSQVNSKLMSKNLAE